MWLTHLTTEYVELNLGIELCYPDPITLSNMQGYILFSKCL